MLQFEIKAGVEPEPDLSWVEVGPEIVVDIVPIVIFTMRLELVLGRLVVVVLQAVVVVLAFINPG